PLEFAEGKPGERRLHEKGRHAALAAAGIHRREQGDDRRLAPVAHPELEPVQDVAVALADGPRRERGRVGAGARLRAREGGGAMRSRAIVRTRSRISRCSAVREKSSRMRDDIIDQPPVADNSRHVRGPIFVSEKSGYLGRAAQVREISTTREAGIDGAVTWR